MTELTPREILDAIRRGLEETARRLSQGKLSQTQGPVQPPRPSEGEGRLSIQLPGAAR